jgi:DNA-binding NarL/FixJ family response regulator
VRTHNSLDNLAWGTPDENQADRERHGTVPRGDNHHSSKLTQSQVLEARDLRASGMAFKEIAERLGANIGTIKSAVRGKSWKASMGIT